MGTEAHDPQAGAKRITRAGDQAPKPLREGLPRVVHKVPSTCSGIFISCHFSTLKCGAG